MGYFYDKAALMTYFERFLHMFHFYDISVPQVIDAVFSR